MKINWSNLLFFDSRSKRGEKVIGYNIIAGCRFRGKMFLVDGVCIGKKSKKQKLLASSYSLKSLGETVFFTNFPTYLSGAFNLKISGLTYGFNVNCSKLTESRIKW